MKYAVLKSRFPPKLTFPIKNKNKKPLMRDWLGSDGMDDDTKKELRRNKLCFSF